jgi:hypothetical protein
MSGPEGRIVDGKRTRAELESTKCVGNRKFRVNSEKQVAGLGSLLG